MKTTITYLLLTFAFLANAQDGILDTSFGTNGKIDYSFFSTFVDMKVDNGKMIALGKHTDGNPILVRFNLDGTLDTTFDNDGIKIVDFGNDSETPASFAIMNHSSGYAYLVASSISGEIAKIMEDGSFFSSFGTNGILEYEATGSYRHASVNYNPSTEKITLVRADGSWNSSDGGKILRLNANGTIDPTFNNGNMKRFYFYSGGQIINLNSAHTDTAGNIYIHGLYTQGGVQDSYTVKFSNVGVQDYSYSLNVNGSRSYDPSPRYLLNGLNSTSYIFGMSTTYKMMVVKKAANGSLDPTFGTNGVVSLDLPNKYYDNVTSIAPYSHGIDDFKIILAGRTRQQTGNSDLFLSRINSNGTLDSTFGTSGFTSVPTTIANHTSPIFLGVDYSNGKIYTMGYTATGIVSMFRYGVNLILQNEETSNYVLKIHPNPTKSNLNFSQEISEIKITDLSGRQVFFNKEKTKNISVENLPKGIYFINGKNNKGEIISEKIIKQ